MTATPTSDVATSDTPTSDALSPDTPTPETTTAVSSNPETTTPETTTLLPSSPDFDALLVDLAKLSRSHLLYFRIEVGRRLSQSFYNDDPELYRKGFRQKEGAFRDFVVAKSAELADLGLSEQLLRQSLRAFYVVKDLPRALVAQLVYSHVVQLTAVEDDKTRALLAKATVENRWTGQALQNAIEAVRTGRWPDADPEQPGLQAAELVPVVPEAGPEVAKPQPGRVVTRFERTAKEVSELMGQWQAVPVEKLTKAQAARVRVAVEALERQVAEMKGRLGA